MLTLKRASAGSGKTYTLTKTYIRLLIAIQDPDSGSWRLRHTSEIPEGVRQILAITFTNKATDEMKSRIVAKLADLAHASETTTTPDYLEDFCKEFKLPEETREQIVCKISTLCSEALGQILIRYSDFNISTIDAFFQSILRTFAFEVELPDTYGVVLENDFLAKTAVTGITDDILHATLKPDTEKWIRLLASRNLERGAHNDIFRDSSQSGSFASSIADIGDLLDAEGYKMHEQDLSNYRLEQLYPAFCRLTDHFHQFVLSRFDALRHSAKTLIDAYDDIAPGGADSFMPGKSRRSGPMRKLLSTPLSKAGSLNLTPLPQPFASGTSQSLISAAPHIPALVEDFNEKAQQMSEIFEDENFRLWKLFENSIPVFAMLREIHSRIKNYLTLTDAVQISDTNSMIGKILDDDIPFIYERYGTTLHHYLIDEFQDTSAMQWKNLSPLLEESLSHRYANLIIGDAKQSIYRFRNADSSLITSGVEDEFSESMEPVGNDPESNANYRSSENVVKFNNLLFHLLSNHLGPSFSQRYDNTVQIPKSKKTGGLAEITFYKSGTSSSQDNDSENDPGSIGADVSRMVVRRIVELLKRGYRQKDIAVLCRASKAGRDVIRALMAWNRDNPSEPPVNFISEDSLALDLAQSVRIVVECLRFVEQAISGGIPDVEVPEPEGGKPSRKIEWHSVAANFSIYAAQHHEMSFEEKIRNFVSLSEAEDSISPILATMQAVTLPSLVEAMIKGFVPEELQLSEAPFLASLQDRVLEYCDVYPTDVTSFLQWWDKTGHNLSISSPEDTDAVNILTIHKSKGLEYECVLLPDLQCTFDLRGQTWTWIKVPENFPQAKHLPSWLPIDLNSKWEVPGEKTMQPIVDGLPAFSPLREAELEDTSEDILNRTYVSFTRAVSEVYAWFPMPSFTKEGLSSKRTLGSMVYKLLSDPQSNLGDQTSGWKIPLMPGANDIMRLNAKGEAMSNSDRECINPLSKDSIEDFSGFRFGNPFAEPAKRNSERNKKEKAKEAEPTPAYYVTGTSSLLQYHPEGIKPYVQFGDDDREDPRSEGSMLHMILEHIKTPRDIARAVRSVHSRGLISRAQAERYKELLTEAITNLKHKEWFDCSGRIFAERAMAIEGSGIRRADRVIIYEDNTVDVIDYKFGQPQSTHKKQVRNYMKILNKILRPKAIRGYLWYIPQNQITEILLSET